MTNQHSSTNITMKMFVLKLLLAFMYANVCMTAYSSIQMQNKSNQNTKIQKNNSGIVITHINSPCQMLNCTKMKTIIC